MLVASHYFNPYADKTFWGVLALLAKRLIQALSGDLSTGDLASDEIQMLVLIGVASSSALVGTFLVLRKMSMLANSLSHTMLIGIVIAFWWMNRGDHAVLHGSLQLNIPAMMMASLAMGLVTVFLTEWLIQKAHLQEDASIGLVFTTLFALGIVALTALTRNAHIGTEVVMGNVDVLQLSDCNLVYMVLGGNLLLIALFFKEFKITTFDAGLAQALGFSPAFFNYLLMTQVSATSIAAFRAVGVLMVLAFITGPVLSARLITHDLKKMILLAVAIGSSSAIVGVALARHLLTVYDLALSTGGLVVCIVVVFFLLAVAFTLARK